MRLLSSLIVSAASLGGGRIASAWRGTASNDELPAISLSSATASRTFGRNAAPTGRAGGPYEPVRRIAGSTSPVIHRRIAFACGLLLRRMRA